MSGDDASNTLFYGDSLNVLTEQLAAASVALIYLDPPFNSKRDYNMPLGGKAQASVFQDTWEWSDEQEEARQYIAARDADLRGRLDALQDFVRLTLGERSPLQAYLIYMAARLLACRRVLKETGSIYLHCDPTAGHYLKLLMDAVFGGGNFRNEIIWAYKSRPQAKRYFGRKHDTILLYAVSDQHIFNWEAVARPLTAESISKYRLVDEEDRKYRLQGRGITGSPIRSAKDVDPKWEIERPELVVRDYLDEKIGVAREDWWTDINLLNQSAKERLGYPTQKPLALLERIIQASSNEGDLVLDPFCGCGTAVEAAHNLGRRWIGIDVEPLAVDLMARRLRERCGIDPQIRGIPYDFAQARRLAEQAPYEFERWAIRLIPGAQPNFQQRGDGGLDGRAYVDAVDEAGRQPLFGFQVKGGRNVGRPALDAFGGALTQNGCAAGLLVVLEERTAHRLRGQLATQERMRLGEWSGGRIGVWSVEDWFGRSGVCLASLPPLVGAGETLELLRRRDWQRRLGV
ncbi:MAG: DNA methyltransferase [Anaerolineaceae bacterium]|nr:DNA methyltransferase [Anaerolineaceae bacterium]